MLRLLILGNKRGKLNILLLCLILITSVSPKKCDLCHFKNFKAECTSSLTNHPINIVIYFNVCHKPIDVTFIITDKNNSINWKHTFVTTNIVETKTFEGFKDLVDLHVVLKHNDPREVVIQGDLHIGSSKGQFIVDETVEVGDKSNCILTSNTLVYHFVLTLATVLILALCTAAVLFYHHKKKTLDLLTLTENEEPAGLPGAFPYQEGQEECKTNPILKFFRTKMKRDIQVQYTSCDNSYNATCIIQNTFTQPNASLVTS